MLHLGYAHDVAEYMGREGWPDGGCAQEEERRVESEQRGI